MEFNVLFSVQCLFLLCLVGISTSVHDYEYYQYDIELPEKDGKGWRSGHSYRERRYVESVITRLADNSASSSGSSASLHDKDGSIGGGGGLRMEMVGNVAVPIHQQSQDAKETHDIDEHVDHPEDHHDRMDIGRGPSKIPTAVPQLSVASTLATASQTPPAIPTHMDKLSKDWLSKKAPGGLLDDKKPIYDPKKAATGHEGLRRTTEMTTSGDSELEGSSGDFPQEVTNNTLEDHNITKKEMDQHKYYNSSFISNPDIGKEYWVDFDNERDVVVNEMLSKSHRRASTVKLNFDFPFYGHIVRNMTIATGGFLYTGDYIHSWLAATQYIAPLMANFDLSLSSNSRVKYRDNGTALTVEWERVMLQDRKTAGEFTFQATLHSTGDIVFVYKQIPVTVEEIEDTMHPVKVGLSDAYIIDKTIYFVRRKTIYEYHRVNFNREHIKNWTVILLSALPTCMDNHNCNTCLTANLKYDCFWCESVKRCSNGYDRKRQEWELEGCDQSSVSDLAKCSIASATSSINTAAVSSKLPESSSSHVHLPQVGDLTGQIIRTSDDVHGTSLHHMDHDSASGAGTPGLMGAMVVLVLLAALGMWVLYAYRNPHTRSGQVLIKYRPSQWTQWRRGEARYTAASIHM